MARIIVKGKSGRFEKFDGRKKQTIVIIGNDENVIVKTNAKVNKKQFKNLRRRAAKNPFSNFSDSITLLGQKTAKAKRPIRFSRTDFRKTVKKFKLKSDKKNVERMQFRSNIKSNRDFRDFVFSVIKSNVLKDFDIDNVSYRLQANTEIMFNKKKTGTTFPVVSFFRQLPIRDSFIAADVDDVYDRIFSKLLVKIRGSDKRARISKISAQIIFKIEE